MSSNCVAQPSASFTIDRYNVCSGTTVTLTNTSTGANAYEWLIEGNHHAYSADTVATLVEPCWDLQEIKLIATDTVSMQSDSVSIVVEVFDTCFFHWNGDFLMCLGDTVTMVGNPEEIATQFVITPPHTLISGCLNCPTLQFVLTAAGTTVERTSTYLGGCTEITSYHYICTLGAEEKGQVNNINIFPNPATEALFLKSDNRISAIHVYDMLGQLCFGRQQIFQQEAKLDISALNPGLHVVHVTTDSGETVRKKFLKN